ncbi:BQ5605_C004g03098 [Microbotryum silenes-dioicae]|uniref:BQ5605_C004g03098 protein n=1 Tax=Microbotryum silenes-dioicae TaxID=796604 RepID=A0A2X0MEA0_9BASI|nr:BQ5605_C004g03098 [Microbotryum silenes-dioicae]
MAVCIHFKTRHWECERSKSTGHFSTCCSQGKVQLPPPPSPIPSIEIYLKDSVQSSSIPQKRPVAQQRAVFHFDQTRLGTLGLPVFRVFGRRYHRLGALIPAVNQRPAFAQIWLIDLAEATDTRLGPDGADSRIQRSTLTKLESMLRTKNHFVREVDPAPLPPARPRSTHPQPSYVKHGNGDAYLRFRHQHRRSWTARPYSPARSIRPRCLSVTHYFFLQGKMASTPTFLFAVSTKLGRPSPETESRLAKVSNRARYLPVSVLLTKAKRTKTVTMRMKTAGDEKNGDGERRRSSKGVEVVSLAFTILCALIAKRDEYFSIPHCTQRPFLEFNLRLTTTQGINGLTPNPIGRLMTLGSTFENRPCDITQRYQDAMACVVKHGKPPLLITMTYDPEAPEIKAALGLNDKACTRPDLIAQVFEAKSGNKRHAGCFGDECRMNGFVSLLYFVGCFLNLCAEIM